MKTKANQRINKLFNIDVKSVDETARTIEFCFSDDQPDRMGEIVEQSSWDLKNYENNPLILWGHNSSEPENVLGQGIGTRLNVGGKSFVTAQFDDADVNPKAALVFKQLVKRTLRTVSAGFIPHKIEYDAGGEDYPVLKECELLEISVVPIPANPRAMALALQEGSISRKDAEHLLRSMREETAFIEKELRKDDGEVVEKDMEELKAQIAELQTAVATLTESVGTITEAVTTVVEQTKPADAGAETDEEKAAREQAEADEAERQRKEEEEAAAKGGNDPSGADDGEFDPDAELTPELQAEIDGILAEEAAGDGQSDTSSTE